ncbi:hypothetical protein J4Q44_G00218270, partial [Coregonus suidteri]
MVVISKHNISLQLEDSLIEPAWSIRWVGFELWGLFHWFHCARLIKVHLKYYIIGYPFLQSTTTQLLLAGGTPTQLLLAGGTPTQGLLAGGTTTQLLLACGTPTQLLLGCGTP